MLVTAFLGARRRRDAPRADAAHGQRGDDAGEGADGAREREGKARGLRAPGPRGLRGADARVRRLRGRVRPAGAGDGGGGGGVARLVERFDRRGTEPFELFTSEFG